MRQKLFVGLLIILLCCYRLVSTPEREPEPSPEPRWSDPIPEAEPTPGTELTPKTSLETLVVTSEFEDEFDNESILPSRIISGVNTFVFFLAYSRSGHSIVASLMDSHPHMVVSHEFDLFNKLASGYLAPNKSDIFNALWENTRESIMYDGLRAETSDSKGYTLFVDGLYQGRYVDRIDVIGDKKGLITVKMLLENPYKWLVAFNILKSLNTTMKVINVIRNPYDNIATEVLYRAVVMHNEFAIIKESNETYNISSELIMMEISNYFSCHNATVNARKEYNLDTIEIHSKDLISDPKGTLLKICSGLKVTCSSNYLKICSNKIFKSESRTRYMVQWTDEQLQAIQQNIDMYSNLKGYSFDSL